MWLYVPRHSAPESADSTLDSVSLADLLHRSCTWKGKRRLARLWLRALKTALSNRLQYGRISQHSMARAFEDWLTSHAQACPANRTPSPAGEQDTPTNELSGPSSYEWWERCSQTWFSSKMFLSFCDTSDQLETNYHDWATALRSRYSSRLPTLALPIEGSESLSWPTATAHDATGKRSEAATLSDHHYYPHDLAGSVQNWPTATAHDQHERYQKNAQGGTPLTAAAHRWPSPRSEDGESCGNHPSATDSLTGATKTWKTPHGMGSIDHSGKQGSGGEFHKQVMMWSTPRTITGGGESAQRKKELGRTESGRGDLQSQIQQQARTFPTPAARDYRSPNKRSYQERSGTTKGEQLSNYVAHSLQGQETPTGLPSSTDSLLFPQRLNPAFVSWLMGLPWWWTHPEPINFARSEMALYLCRQQSRLRFLLDALDSKRG